MWIYFQKFEHYNDDNCNNNEEIKMEVSETGAQNVQKSSTSTSESVNEVSIFDSNYFYQFEKEKIQLKITQNAYLRCQF